MSYPTPDQEAIRIDAVRQVATLMAAAAITAPKSGGQLFLAGKPAFMETVIIEDQATRGRLADWLRARGAERREPIWFRDAEVAQAVDAILFIGLAPNWYPPNYDCGACGYATCAEFLHATKDLRRDSDELEFTGPTCNLRDIDLGIAIGPRPGQQTCTRSTAAARPASQSPPQTRPHHRRDRGSPLAIGHTQGDRLRPADAGDRLRRPQPPGHRNPAHRRTRRLPITRSPESATAPIPDL